MHVACCVACVVLGPVSVVVVSVVVVVVVVAVVAVGCHVVVPVVVFVVVWFVVLRVCAASLVHGAASQTKTKNALSEPSCRCHPSRPAAHRAVAREAGTLTK